MNDILTWISTVGWSPYAVINPLWAYCKANDEYPDKVILLFTGAGIIKNNFKMCKDSITKILKSFTNNRFKSDKIIGHELKTENFETYAEELRKIIYVCVDDDLWNGVKLQKSSHRCVLSSFRRR